MSSIVQRKQLPIGTETEFYVLSKERSKVERNAVTRDRSTNYETKKFDFCVSRSFSP